MSGASTSGGPHAAAAQVQSLFTVTEVARLFGLSESRLRYWDQVGFISPSHRQGGRRLYAFRDLIAVKTARALIASGASLQKVRRSLEQLRAQLPDVAQPLAELRVVCHGDRVLVLNGDAPFEAETGQLLLQFGTAALSAEIARLHQLPGTGTPAAAPPPPTREPAAPRPDAAAPPQSAYQWFLRGCELDADPGKAEQAVAAYRRALELDPALAAAHTNLGNLFHRLGEPARARAHYEQALELDPEQPEARYNRANLLHEAGELEEAIAEYRQVLLRVPDFADAHHNLALALEQVGSRIQARLHRERYLALCPDAAPSGDSRGGRT